MTAPFLWAVEYVNVRRALRNRYIGATVIVLSTAAVVSSFPPNIRAEMPEPGDKSEVAKSIDVAQPASSPQTFPQASGATLAVGDRIRVSFFETLEIKKVGAAAVSQQPVVRPFYQRLDLSGEYTIQQDGDIVLPRLGAFRVVGHSPRRAQADIAAAYEKVMDRHCEINIAIIERQPIYVIGKLKNQGMHKYVFGMTVLHAIALAGGVDHGLEQFNRAVDLLRERKEANGLRDKLSQALAQKARFEAERDGLEKPLLSDRLLHIAGKTQSEALLAAESARLAQDRLTLKDETSRRAEDMARAKLELTMLESKKASYLAQLEARRKRLSLLQEAGSTVLISTLNAVEKEKADLEFRYEDALFEIENTKQKLLQLERSETFRERDRALRLTLQIAANDQEISNLEKAFHSSSAIVRLMECAIDVQPDSLEAPLQIEIVRQGLGVPSVIDADEKSNLEPGDIVRIKTSSPKAAPKAGCFALPLQATS